MRAAFRRPAVRLASGLAVLLLVAWISGRFETGPAGTEVRGPRSPATPSPSLSDARWEGRWHFDYTLTELQGIGGEVSELNVGSKIRRIWDVTPKCDRGPCSIDISATDPDNPSRKPASTAVSYEDGVYRTSQTFPPFHSEVCRGADGRELQAQFEATNLVEVIPTQFEVQGGEAVVSELKATKTTTFSPTGPAKDAGGSCSLKGAIWVATVTPAR